MIWGDQGKKLGATALQRASTASTANPELGNCNFELQSLFHHVVWMGDMNFKLADSITPEDAIMGEFDAVFMLFFMLFLLLFLCCFYTVSAVHSHRSKGARGSS